MSEHGATTRRPVYSGNQRVPGLYERALASGATVYEAGLRLGGKVRRQRLDATTKTDAIAELRALQVDHARGEAYRSPSMAPTLGDVAADFIAHMRTRIGDRDAKRRRSARTVAHYDQQLRLHVLPALGHRPACELSVADLRRLLDALAAERLSPSTRTGALNILSSVMRYAVKQGVIERNIVRDLDRDDRPGAARQTEPRYLTADELDALLSRVGDTFRPAVATCTFAALRISEALGLRWRDVDFAGERITVGGQLGTDGERVPVKSAASAATVPLLPALARELREHRSRHASRDLRRIHADAYVFTTARGKPQSRRNALRAVHAAGDAAGLNGDGREPVGLHDLRHSYVALALSAGATMAETAALARHANARVTAQVYAGLADDGRATAATKLVDAGFGT